MADDRPEFDDPRDAEIIDAYDVLRLKHTIEMQRELHPNMRPVVIKGMWGIRWVNRDPTDASLPTKPCGQGRS